MQQQSDTNSGLNNRLISNDNTIPIFSRQILAKVLLCPTQMHKINMKLNKFYYNTISENCNKIQSCDLLLIKA